MMDKSQSIDAFLNAAAAKQPTPGGGSVTALVGALAASMGEMVLHYSVGKKDLVAYQAELQTALAEFTRARLLLLQLMVEDQEAFAEVQAARKLPESHLARQVDIDAAVLACIRVPQAIGATALVILELSETLVGKVNKYLLSDLAVCADLATATVRCAGYNVRVNLPDVTKVELREKLKSETEDLLKRSVAVVQRVSPAIWARVG
jgi:formiminotetrahydrofolate cyclodeaminase